MYYDGGVGCNKSKSKGFEIHKLNLWLTTIWLWDKKGLPIIIGIQRELGAIRGNIVFETKKLLKENKKR